MASAILKAGSRSYSLKSGVYLIRGSSVAESVSEFNLILEHESIEDKHAMICIGNDVITIYDLETANGTFVNEKRLSSLSKCSLEEGAKIRFGALEASLQLCNALEQHQSSGFHDASYTSSNTSAKVLVTSLKNMPTDTVDSFVIPETQFVPPAGDISEKSTETSKERSFNSSIPETQEVHTDSPATVVENNGVKLVTEAIMPSSQFALTSQEFKECCEATVASDSSDLLTDIEWFLCSKQSNDKEEMVALHLSSATTSRCEASSLQVDLRIQTQTPDLFDASVMDLIDKENDKEENKMKEGQDEFKKTNEIDMEQQPKIASETSQKATTSAALMKTSTAEISTIIVSNVQPNTDNPEAEVFSTKECESPEKICQPLSGLSDKENLVTNAIALNDLEPTQVFVSKKESKSSTSSNIKSLLPVECDLEPTQVFVSKKAFKCPKPICSPIINNDLEPTQIFVPKNLKAVKQTDVQSNQKEFALNSTMVSTHESTCNPRNLCNFFKDVENNSESEEIHNNKETINKANKKTNNDEPELLMNTPQMIADGLNEAISMECKEKKRKDDQNLFDDIFDDDDALTHMLTAPRIQGDFDKLIQSINKSKKEKNKEIENIEKSKAEAKPVEENKKKDVENQKVTFKLDKSAEDKISNRDLRNAATKRHAIENPVQNTKRSKQETKNEKASSNNVEKLPEEKRRKAVEIRTEISRPKSDFSSKEQTSNFKQMQQKGREINEKVKKLETKKETNPSTSKKIYNNEETKITKKSIRSNSKMTDDGKNEKRKLRSNSGSTSERSESTSKTRTSSNSKNSSKAQMEEDKTKEQTKKTHSAELQKKESRPKIDNKLLSRDKSLSQESNSDIDINKKSTRHIKEKKRNQTISESGNETTSSESKSSRNELREKINAQITEIVALGKRTRSRAMSNLSEDNKKIKTSIDIADDQPSPSKKSTGNAQKNTALKVAFTMVAPEKLEALLQSKSNLWQIVTNSMDSEVLVMDDGKRTVKFLIAVAKGIPIVTTKWLEAVNKTNTVSIRREFFFKNIEFERLFNFSLLQTLNKANDIKLFENYQFLCTPNISPDPKDMKAIITSAAGVVYNKVPALKDDKTFFIISCETDRKTWHGYRRINSNICIINTEAIMQAIMRYDITLLQAHVL